MWSADQEVAGVLVVVDGGWQRARAVTLVPASVSEWLRARAVTLVLASVGEWLRARAVTLVLASCGGDVVALFVDRPIVTFDFVMFPFLRSVSAS